MQVLFLNISLLQKLPLKRKSFIPYSELSETDSLVERKKMVKINVHLQVVPLSTSNNI